MPKELLKSLVGLEGTCRTWFEPEKLADETKITGEFKPLLNGRLAPRLRVNHSRKAASRRRNHCL